MNTPETTFKTIRDLVRYGVTQFSKEKLFFGHGTDNAYDEAVYLILHTLSLPIHQLEPYLDATLLPDEIQAVLDVLNRRITQRLPAAYITNEAWLQGYSFYIEKGVIIPRSFIAELILEQFAPWIEEPENIHSVIDLCTGSGCLAIMLADAFPNASVDGIELSAQAIGVAQTNIKRYNMQDRISLYHGDVYDGIPDKKYQLMVTNPPYVNDDAMTRLPFEYKHEPSMALAGGLDGMQIIRRILKTASEKLTEDGILIVEVGNEAQHAKNAFPELDFVWLSTSGGDEKVFLLTADELKKLSFA